MTTCYFQWANEYGRCGMHTPEEQLRQERMREQGRVKEFYELVKLGNQRGYKNPYMWAKFVWNARQAKQKRA